MFSMPHKMTKSEQTLLEIKKQLRKKETSCMGSFAIITVGDILIPRVDDHDHQTNLKEVLLCLAKSKLRLKGEGVCICYHK